MSGANEPSSSAAAGRPDVSVVFPVRDEEGNLRELYTRVRGALGQAGVSYEMVFVDDGSEDGSLVLIKQLRERDVNVRYLSLSKNFGHQTSLFAGLCHARGSAVVMMDADLQHPPELLPEMIQRWREGYEVVYTVKRNARMPWFWRWQMRLFYRVMSKISGLELSFGQSDFRLLDRKVADVLQSIPGYRKFLRGLVRWVGFKQIGLPYTVADRRQGRSKYSYWLLAKLALDGVFSFSVAPLRLLFFGGLGVATLTLPYIAVIIVLALQRAMGGSVEMPSGWATVAVSVLWLGSVQLMAIGVLGEYMGRMYIQTRGLPAFIVRDASDELGTASPAQAAYVVGESETA